MGMLEAFKQKRERCWRNSVLCGVALQKVFASFEKDTVASCVSCCLTKAVVVQTWKPVHVWTSHPEPLIALCLVSNWGAASRCGTDNSHEPPLRNSTEICYVSPMSLIQYLLPLPCGGGPAGKGNAVPELGEVQRRRSHQPFQITDRGKAWNSISSADYLQFINWKSIKIN